MKNKMPPTSGKKETIISTLVHLSGELVRSLDDDELRRFEALSDHWRKFAESEIKRRREVKHGR
jgi:hypothetical protein